MKNLKLALLVSLFPMIASAKTVALDTAASSVKWVGKKVTGQHNGTVDLKSGEVAIEKDRITGGHFEIDMNSIKDTDLTDEKYNTKLVTHLKSDDFFGVEKNPVSKFSIKSVKPLKGSKEGTHQISGDLTIKGITNPVSFPATVEVKGDKATAKANFKVDRTKYNVRYGSGKFFENLGDKMINDEFEIALDLKTK